MFEIRLQIRLGRDIEVPISMSNWMDDAKAREDKAAQEQKDIETARVAAVNRLKIAFPDWQSTLFRGLEKVCKELCDKFPGRFDRHFSVNVQPNGYLVRGQGIPSKSAEITFQLETQTMVVRHFVSNNIHDPDSRSAWQNNGTISLTPQSTVYIQYIPRLMWDSPKIQKYSDPAILAEDLLRELTQL